MLDVVTCGVEKNHNVEVKWIWSDLRRNAEAKEKRPDQEI